MVRSSTLALALASAALVAPAAASAQTALFDLEGPGVAFTVTRGERMLPVSAVPTLRAGDRLTIRAQLPEDQSARYMLVVAFLRGATNPPPKDWFHRARSWRPREATMTVEVPEGAEQAVLFLAPSTGGGYDAIVDAVRGRPGIFVRAAQDLGQASLDRARLDAFVDGIRHVDDRDPERVQAASTALARSLAVQLNADCLRRQPGSQASCLTQSRDAIVLYNARGTSLTETLTGAPADLAYRVAATREGGSGFYSPYIGVLRDVARLLGAFQTADYQYIPALTLGQADGYGLILNTAPSFERPHSVLVAAMPPIGEAAGIVPRLDPPPAALCATAPNLVLPVDGAPLLYATRFARDARLQLQGAHRGVSIPLVADAERGGFVPAAGAAVPALDGPVTATLTADWGFEPLASAAFALQMAAGADWQVASGTPLVRGREGRVRLSGPGACVAAVTLDGRALDWTADGGSIEVTVPAAAVPDGDVRLRVRMHGVPQPMTVSLGESSSVPRPAATLIGRSVERRPSRIAIAGNEAIPADARLTFSLKAEGGRFGREDRIEVATESGATATLTPRLQDATTSIATLVPGEALGASAYGPMRVRIVRGDVQGDWRPLGTLVRLPEIGAVRCGADGCAIEGRDLFLLASVGDPAVEVPSGFTGTRIEVPGEDGGRIAVRLRDAADVAATVTSGS